MRFSVMSAAAGARGPIELAELAKQAEVAGWDGFFLEDYLVYQGDESVATYDPWICLAAMASATERIRLGTTVTPLSRRRPWRVAAEALTLDRLSGGRFILGVGSGNGADTDFVATGEPAEQRVLAERLDEGLEIIGGLLAGQRVTFRGRHYRVDGLRFEAAASGRSQVPIWIGGNLLAPPVRRRIVRWDGSCAYKGTPGSDAGPITADDVAVLVQQRAATGTINGFDVKVSGTDAPDVIASLEEAGATWWGRWVNPIEIDLLRRVISAGPPR